MSNKYPRLTKCITYEMKDDNSVLINNQLTCEEYLMGIDEFEFLLQLDGKTNPYSIETHFTTEEIDSLIEDADECGLIKFGNITSVSGGTTLYTVWEPSWNMCQRAFATAYNKILSVCWLPIFLLGVLVFYKNMYSIEYDFAFWGSLLGLVIGMVLHEIGHASAGVSYGADVYEMGFLRMYYILPGAYVMLNKDSVKSRIKRAQINAAGIETNMLLVGIFLILSVVFNDIGGLFFTAAVQNFLLAVVNLSIVGSFDGAAIISEFLGVEDIVEKAKKVVFSGKYRRKIKKHGLVGRATIAICYLILSFQIALPVLLILNVWEIILCFI